MPEDIAAVLFSMCGSVLYSSFIAVCVSLMMEMDQERVRYMGQVHRLNHYMGRRQVPLEIRHRAREYMEMQWDHQGGHQDEDILKYVSRSIRRDISMHNSASLITGVPFLKVNICIQIMNIRIQIMNVRIQIMNIRIQACALYGYTYISSSMCRGRSGGTFRCTTPRRSSRASRFSRSIFSSPLFLSNLELSETQKSMSLKYEPCSRSISAAYPPSACTLLCLFFLRFKDILKYVSRSIRRDISMHNAASLITGVPFLKVNSTRISTDHEYDLQ